MRHDLSDKIYQTRLGGLAGSSGYFRWRVEDGDDRDKADQYTEVTWVCVEKARVGIKL